MRLLLSQAKVYRQDGFAVRDVAISDDRIERVSPWIEPSHFDRVVDLSKGYLFPGFVDVHVHLREPGFSYKETIKTGTMAAARGGYTAVCAMPNLIPAPDCAAHVRAQLAILQRDARVRVYPYGALTAGQKGAGTLADYAGMRDLICGLSDDGRGVQDEGLMREAMLRAKALGLIVAAHCEDERELLSCGAVHDGLAARKYGVTGISSKSEWAMVKRDLKLAKETGCRYHVCHVSTRESVALIRAAKADGVDCSFETGPHYLVYSDQDLLDEGRFKMNPPIRAIEDREALIEGLADGTIDMIATDHAPHASEEKAKGLAGSVMGVVGLETAFAEMYTRFVRPGILTLDRLVALLAVAPRHRFGLDGGSIEAGQPADLAAYDLDAEWIVDPGGFASMGKATPFEGDRVWGRTMLTMVGGGIVYENV